MKLKFQKRKFLTVVIVFSMYGGSVVYANEERAISIKQI